MSLKKKFEEEDDSQPEDVASEFLAAAKHISSSLSSSKSRKVEVVDLWKFAYVNVLERSEAAAKLILEEAVLK